MDFVSDFYLFFVPVFMVVRNILAPVRHPYFPQLFVVLIAPSIPQKRAGNHVKRNSPDWRGNCESIASLVLLVQMHWFHHVRVISIPRLHRSDQLQVKGPVEHRNYIADRWGKVIREVEVVEVADDVVIQGEDAQEDWHHLHDQINDPDAYRSRYVVYKRGKV